MTNKLGIKFCGPLRDSSGYAQFGRNFVAGLTGISEIDLCLEPISFEAARPNLGKIDDIIKTLTAKKSSYDIKIINACPDVTMLKLIESNKKNVCFTMFETTRIPDEWVTNLNRLAACLVPCTWNKEVFQSSGVKVPIYVVPPGIDAEFYQQIENLEPTELANLPKDCVSFYSIFQWTERKNPIGLIVSYLSAFDGVEDVCLVLKTYGADTSAAQQQRIKDMIVSIKGQLRMKKAPKILFIGNLLSTEQITGLHKRCDCFVLPHRAEGFGMPHLEAMACGKPVIATGFSGNMDFMNPNNSYLLDYQMTVVCNMPWIKWYEADMEWADPNLSQLKEYMKKVYKHIKMHKEHPGELYETQEKALQGKTDVLKDFNLRVSADRLVEVCKEINNA